MTGTRPETPPRYRYIRSGTSDDEQENDRNGNTVLAARKRAGSVGRPVLISRRLDRQRHGGTHVLGEAAVPPQSVLQAPALLGLGCLDANASFGLDMFTRRHLDFAARVPNESRNWIGNDPMAFIPAVPAAPSSAWPCMAAKSACRSQSVGTNVRRESAFLRPSGTFFGAPAPAPTMAPPPLRPHSVFSHVPPRCNSFSWQSVPGTASACLQADGQEHSAPPRPPQSGPGPLFAKPEQDAQVHVQADSFQIQLSTPCAHSIFPSVDEHPSTWQPQKHTALQELQWQQGMPRQSDKDPQLVEKLQSSQTKQVEHEQSSGGSCEHAEDLNSVRDGHVPKAMRSASRSKPEFGGSLQPPQPWPATGPPHNRSQMSCARILITGASGLLGRQVMKAFSTWQVQGVCKRRANMSNIAACDLTNEAAVAQLMEHFRPHVVLHLAAEWRPEVLRQRPEQARQLNVDATGFLATACERLGAWLVHVSADCVFDGTSPPYTTNSKPNPLSEYGWHKLHSEQLAQAACPQAAVLRVPLLYGPLAASLSESAVTSLCADLSNGIREVDAWQQCYPTWTGDVASVLKNMVELHLAGECLQGIYHFQSSERFTWHEMMLIVAEVAGLDASGISAVRSPPATSLPRDTQLDCSRLTQLLGRCPETRLRDGLRQCLPCFRDACATQAEQAGGAVDPDPRNHGATLQKVFWEELERTRRRLRQAGINQQRARAEGRSRGRDVGADMLAPPGEQRLYEQQV